MVLGGRGEATLAFSQKNSAVCSFEVWEAAVLCKEYCQHKSQRLSICKSSVFTESPGKCGLVGDVFFPKLQEP